MRKIPAMVSMKRTPAEVKADAMPTPDVYPYGLSISLCDDELEKLGLGDDVQVGDMLHLHCMGKVTAVSKHDSEAGGSSRRVEIQITDMVGESEDDENDAADLMPAAKRRARLYG